MDVVEEKRRGAGGEVCRQTWVTHLITGGPQGPREHREGRGVGGLGDRGGRGGWGWGVERGRRRWKRRGEEGGGGKEVGEVGREGG